MSDTNFRVPERLAAASNLDIALSWVALGCRVHPVGVTRIIIAGQTEIIKTRLTSSWTKEALSDPALIQRYWDANPDHMVGVIPGSAVFVLDVDRHADKDGFKSLTDAGLSIPATYYTTTPSGGEHHFYRAVAGMRHDANLMYGGNLLVGVDRRCGDGSYFHAYSLAPDPAALPDAPSWALGRKTRSDGAEGVGYSGTVDEWLAEHTDPIGISMSTITNNFPAGDFDRADMLRLQTRVVLAAVDGWAGGAAALEMLRGLWLAGQWDTPKYRQDWDKGLEGAIAKFGGVVASEPFTELEPEMPTADKFRQAVDKTKEGFLITETARAEYLAETSAFGIFNADDVVNIADYVPPFEQTPLIDGVLDRGSVVMLYADSYVGKSYVALDWGLSIASGRGWWAGHKVDKGRVLYLAMEGSVSLLKRYDAWLEYTGLSKADTRDFNLFAKVVDFTSGESHKLLADTVQAGAYDLVVIDMAAQAMGALDENAPTDVRYWMGKVTELREANPGCAVVFLHHSKKDDPTRFRGGGPFYGSSDIVWNMTRLDPEDDEDPRRVLHCTKSKASGGRKIPDVILSFETQSCGDSILDVASGGDKFSEALTALHNDTAVVFPITQVTLARKVAEMFGGVTTTYQNKIGRAVANGKLPKGDFR